MASNLFTAYAYNTEYNKKFQIEKKKKKRNERREIFSLN